MDIFFFFYMKKCGMFATPFLLFSTPSALLAQSVVTKHKKRCRAPFLFSGIHFNRVMLLMCCGINKATFLVQINCIYIYMSVVLTVSQQGKFHIQDKEKSYSPLK